MKTREDEYAARCVLRWPLKGKDKKGKGKVRMNISHKTNTRCQKENTIRKSVFLSVVGLAFAAGADVTALKLTGPFGDRLDRMIRNHVEVTDARLLADVFHGRTKAGWWQSEFWGKYMHAAVPLWTYSQNAALGANIDAGVEAILASQEPGGYIGNYPENVRFGGGWDVWGIKYTLMGLLHYYDGTRSRSKVEVERGDAALVAAKKLCDALIAALGPEGTKKRPLYKTGCYVGMASSSVLEPVVWLYRRTGEKRYLDFADFIVKGMTEAEDGPRLVDLVEKGISVADRNGYGNKPLVKGKYWTSESRSKAYEMMSCYQGLLDYVEEVEKSGVGGERTRRLWKATLLTAEDILKEEINIVGGASCGERWYHGARKQSLQYVNVQETCVVTTWMRFCEKLLDRTDDPKWADEIEKTFYNAYLGAQRPDGSDFVQYTSLCGRRHAGENQSRLYVNCCTANGPRGYLAFFGSMLGADGRAVLVNQYVSGEASVVLPETGQRISLETYADYPKNGNVSIRYREREPKRFALKLRIPGWSKVTSVSLNRKDVSDVRPGTYLTIDREWTCGDQVDLAFDYSVQAFELNGHAAFKMGPLVLARDRRFDDGDLDEVIARHPWIPDPMKDLRFFPTRTRREDMFFTALGLLTTGAHTKNAGEKYPSAINFCDYGSAGNSWTDASAYRVWLPIEADPKEGK